MQQLQPSTLLQGGKYKIIKVLGQGGFGITYLAEQPLLHRKVAIKEFFMKEHCNRDENTSNVSIGSEGSTELVGRFKEKFLKEAGLIASLSHHNIVQIYDIFEENGTAYYVMENINGGSLDEKVKQGALPESEALCYTRQIADALSFIHSHNTLHLDIKPANILIRSNGEAVLIDFGISKHYDEQGGQTSTTPTGISKGYAPMEQYNQGLAKFTPATDIYSLGATLYKMVTGKTPPEASLLLNDDEELEKPDGVSFSTWTAIEKAMEPKVKKRPQSIADFISILGVESNDTKQVQNVKTQSEETIFINSTPTAKSEETIVAKPAQFKDNENSHLVECNESIKIFNVNGATFRMIKVEGGTFDMKETVSCGFLGMSSKEIVQKTTLSDYWIGETQVTQTLWKAVMGNNPSSFKGDNLPIDSVSWNDCNKFISQLNAITKLNFRLPTEAEWEFAARGGNKTNHYIYSGSNKLEEVAWYAGNTDNASHFVASKQSNELGIFDMSGNVWEWCSDKFGDYIDGAINNPTGTKNGDNHHVRRGGSWFSHACKCNNTSRESIAADYSSANQGFRLTIS